MKSKAAQPLGDVIASTRKFHQHLAESLDVSANESTDTRTRMLMNYLEEHERKLEKALEILQNNVEQEDLRTWFYDYAQPKNVLRTEPRHKPFSKMTVEELIGEVADQHKEVIEFYRYMYGRAGGSHAGELLRELVELEQTETNLMMYEAERVEEM